MCNPEPTTLAEYCEQSVAANVLSNAVAMQGMTDVEAAHATPFVPKWARSGALGESPELCDIGYQRPIESQTVETSAQVPTQTADAPAQSILAEADAIAGQDRARDYGHPLANHRRIAEIWNVQLEKKLAVPLTPGDVVTLMIGLKLARLVNSPNHRDSFVDICGYAKCWDMIQEAGGE